jgi:hypothetical protein
MIMIDNENKKVTIFVFSDALRLQDSVAVVSVSPYNKSDGYSELIESHFYQA